MERRQFLGRQAGRQAGRQRNLNIDFIRVVACVAVIGLHSCYPRNISLSEFSTGAIGSSIIYYLCGFAVPFFFMTSGYFLLTRGKIDWRYSFHKVLRILRLIACWDVLVLLCYILKDLVTDGTTSTTILSFPLEIIKSLVQKGHMWQFWYLGTLLILYCMLPVITRVLNNHEKRWIILTGIMAAVCVGFVIASYIKGSPVQKQVIQTFRLWTWLLYFSLGGLIEKRGQLKLSAKAHVVIVLLITIMLLSWQMYVGTHLITEDTNLLHAEYFYDSPLEMIWVFLLFTLLMRVKTEHLAPFITHVAPLTLGIYIVHPLILCGVRKIITGQSVGYTVLMWLITLIVSYIVTLIIAHTPLKKYLIKL